MDYLDFRSDTVTHPTGDMREAMANASVGDDVYRDDPTVIELEQFAAHLLGKEAALLMPSGTFANQLALQLHCRHGDEVLLSEQSHIVLYETGAAAAFAGVQLRCIDAPSGYIGAAALKERMRKGDMLQPGSRLLCMENAFSSGQVLSAAQMREMSEAARGFGLKIHLDGARLFNAAASLACEPEELACFADTVQICLSKGLCAPMGSLLVGSAADIERSRVLRKRMGGGLRQAGIIAAAGLLSLKEMRHRLSEDHQRARYLADLLEREIPGAKVEREKLDINMVFVQIPGLKTSVQEQLSCERIYIGAPYPAAAPNSNQSIEQSSAHSDQGSDQADKNVRSQNAQSVRLMTHYWTPDAAIERLVSRLAGILQAGR